MFGWWKRRRRQRLLAQPRPATWQGYLERNVRHWAYLDDEQRTRLWQRLTIIVHEKHWVPATGFAVTEEMQVTIAAQASLLLLGITTNYYLDGVRTIVVYPGAYLRPTEPGRLASDEDDDDENQLLGESWHRGPIVLSWTDVLRAGRDHSKGANVVLHEFAHALDGLDGYVEGVPPLDTAEQERRWYRVTEAEYLRLVGNARRGEVTLLDAYGAENRAEFFAVATECFFERPRALRGWHRELYNVLADFYCQDPAAWMIDAQTPLGELPKNSPPTVADALETSVADENVADDHDSPEDLFTRGVAALADEQFEEALADFNQVLHVDPDDGEARVQRALTLLHLDRFDEALVDCDRALELDPRDWQAHQVRGSVRIELEQYVEAVADLDFVLQNEPNDLDALFLRGRAWLALHDPARALIDLDRAARLDQHDAETYAYRGLALKQLGRDDEARADFARAQQLEPELNIEFE